MIYLGYYSGRQPVLFWGSNLFRIDISISIIASSSWRQLDHQCWTADDLYFFDRSIHTLFPDNKRHQHPLWACFTEFLFTPPIFRLILQDTLGASPKWGFLYKWASIQQIQALIDQLTVEKPSSFYLQGCPCSYSSIYFFHE